VVKCIRSFYVNLHFKQTFIKTLTFGTSDNFYIHIFQVPKLYTYSYIPPPEIPIFRYFVLTRSAFEDLGLLVM
jgi:hypothetical protein